MCNYEMVFKTPYSCDKDEVVVLRKEVEEAIHSTSIPFDSEDELIKSVL